MRFVEAQSEGPIFDRMAMQVEIIAGLQGSKEIFHLQSADIYEVIRVERIELL